MNQDLTDTLKAREKHIFDNLTVHVTHTGVVITGSVSGHYDSPAAITLFDANTNTAYEVVGSAIAEVIEIVEGRCDYTDYDPDTHTNLRLVLDTEPTDAQLRSEYIKDRIAIKAVLIDFDYDDVAFCEVVVKRPACSDNNAPFLRGGFTEIVAE